MKLKVYQIIQLWQGINAIYQVNDMLPGPFDYHMIKRNVPILQKEVKSLEELDEEDFEEIKDTEVDLPLSKIKPTMLPDKMPKGALPMIDILVIEQEQPDHESAVAKLLNEKDKDDFDGWIDEEKAKAQESGNPDPVENQ